MADACADAYVLIAADGTIVDVNPAAETMFQWPRAELIGAPLARLLPVSAQAAHAAHVAAFVAAPRALSLRRNTLVARRRDDTEFAVDVGLTPVTTAAGPQVLAAVRDVGEWVSLQRAVAASEAMLADLFELAPDGIFVADPDGRVLDVNRAACALFGVDRAELLGKTPAQLLRAEDVATLTDPDARGRTPGRRFRGEGVVQHRDGRWIPVELTATTLGDGRRVAFVRDLTERRRAEQAVRQAERARARTLRELEAVLEQCPVGITLTRTPDGSVVERNRAARALVGDPDRPPQVLQAAASVLTDFAGRTIPTEELPLVRALRGDVVEGAGYVLRAASGRTLPIEVNAAPLRSDTGDVEGAVATMRDISAAREIERLRAEWSAVVAHDLRQPLNAMRLYLEALAREPVAWSASARRRIAATAGMIARVARMTDDIVDLSRLDARRLALVRHPVDLVACVGAAIEQIAMSAPDRPISLEVRGPVPAVDGDADRLAQVVENLLTNAVKYGEPETPIGVTVEVIAGGRVTVAVANEGVPIPPDQLVRVFQRFERAGVASHVGIPGIGLGLQIAQALVEAHGGAMAVDSGPDALTVFRFTLPAGAQVSPASGDLDGALAG